MTHPPIPPSERPPHPGDDAPMSDLDTYLDDAMAPAQRAEFEKRLAADPALRAELELQRRVDTRLRALVGAPAFPGLLVKPDATSEAGGQLSIPRGAAGTPARRGLPAWLKVAALFAILVLGAWAISTQPWVGVFGPPPSLAAADPLYNRLVRTGFAPDWVCDNDEKFLEYTGKELGTAFLVRPDPSVQLVGWTYSDSLLGENAKILMARHGDKPVIIVIDQKLNDREVRLEPGSPLKIHRGTLDGLVLYEISPENAPAVVNKLVPHK